MAPTRYNAIDALKFIMAFAVIGIHAVALNSTEFNDAVNYWFASAVPFYFVTSGFLLQNKISRSNPAIEKRVMLDYAKRIARMYCLWLLIYLPLTAYACFRYKLEAGQFIVDQIYHLLIFGATLYSWPIWYLYSTAIAVSAIALLHRWRWSKLVLFIIGSAIPPMIYLYNSVGVKELAFSRHLYYIAQGLPIIIAGMWLRDLRITHLWRFIASIALIALTYYINTHWYTQTLLIAGIAMFLLA